MTHREPLSPYTGMIQLAFDQYAPHVHRGFARDWLDLVLRKKWDPVELVRSSGADNLLLDGRKPAFVLTGPDALAEYALPPGCDTLELDVLKQRWSADLVIRDGTGLQIAKLDLHCGYPPAGAREHPLARGNDACRRHLGAQSQVGRLRRVAIGRRGDLSLTSGRCRSR